ncbi:MAG: hypothetical protein KF764_19065 [Labilithrix sp.]|nr:hypothetical protein [Labilithrix sp.]MBX3224899.1 hypothetical protein [Labilithrix sp.]
MKIDKNRFLLLTTTIAATAAAALVVSATGCSTVNTVNNDGSGNGDPVTDSGPTDNDASDESDGGDKDGGPACLGNSGAAPVCGPAEEGEDAGGVAKCSYECDKFNATFKTEIAKDINDCLDLAFDGPTFEGCGGAAPTCVEAAVAKACDDAEAAPFCTTLLAGCSDAGVSVTQEQCTAVARALSEEGKTTLQSCVVESGCGDCFDQLKTTF